MPTCSSGAVAAVETVGVASSNGVKSASSAAASGVEAESVSNNERSSSDTRLHSVLHLSSAEFFSISRSTAA